MGNFPGTQEQPGQTSNNQTIKNALIKIKKKLKKTGSKMQGVWGLPETQLSGLVL